MRNIPFDRGFVVGFVLLTVVTVAVGGVASAQSTAALTFDDQTASDEVVIASVTLPEAGFVAVYDSSGGSPGDLLGSSAELAADTHEDVTVELSSSLSADQELIAVLYRDADENGEFSEDADEQFEADGEPIQATAQITAASGTAVEITVVETRTEAVVQTVTREVTRTVVETKIRTVTVTESDGQPGFGLALGIGTILGAVLLGARRRNA